MKVAARWWKPVARNRILCELCPRFCKIGDGQRGFCFVRKNEGGQLYLTAYGSPTGFAFDPIEKKPLNHFLPGTPILSFGTAGCNLGCRFCQNWDMSKARSDDTRSVEVTPEQVVELASRHGCPSIAYTYNEPTIYGEFVIDVAKLARERGIKNVMVTSGYITPEARDDIYRYIDAANVDLKAFTDEFYFKLTYAHLDDILDTIKWLVDDTDVWIEITNLIIPGYNDNRVDIENMLNWIIENCGDEIPIHFTAFHPDFKMTSVPPTPPETLTQARNLALEKGTKYVYIGNVYDETGQITYCPNCGKKLIERGWHSIRRRDLTGDKCSCGQRINGVFV